MAKTLEFPALGLFYIQFSSKSINQIIVTQIKLIGVLSICFN